MGAGLSGFESRLRHQRHKKRRILTGLRLLIFGRLRIGCGRWRIQQVHLVPVAAGDQVAINVHRHLDAGVSQLFLDINRADPGSQQEAGIGMADIMEPDIPQACLAKHPLNALVEAPFKAYLQALRQALAAGDATEHTRHPALKTLIEALGPGIIATNEPRQVTDCGKPDMEAMKGAVPLGYLETKEIGKNWTQRNGES